MVGGNSPHQSSTASPLTPPPFVFGWGVSLRWVSGPVVGRPGRPCPPSTPPPVSRRRTDPDSGGSLCSPRFHPPIVALVRAQWRRDGPIRAACRTDDWTRLSTAPARAAPKNGSTSWTPSAVGPCSSLTTLFPYPPPARWCFYSLPRPCTRPWTCSHCYLDVSADACVFA